MWYLNFHITQHSAEIVKLLYRHFFYTGGLEAESNLWDYIFKVEVITAGNIYIYSKVAQWKSGYHYTAEMQVSQSRKQGHPVRWENYSGELQYEHV